MLDDREYMGKNLILRNSLICLDICDENKLRKDKQIIKKGKIHKGPICNAYNRENLGSIPGNLENVLLNENKSQIGFLTQSNRFTNSYTRGLKINIPGPGSYHSSTLNTTTNSFNSSKGFGNGFVSNCDRFNERDTNLNKYRPGPGEYISTDKFSVANSVKNSLHYRSLYDKKEIKLLKIRRNLPGPGYYNPILTQAKDKENRALSSFSSEVMRFNKNLKNNQSLVPGPGNYFTESTDEFRPKNTTSSSFFKLPMQKKENLFEKYVISDNNTEENNGPTKYDSGEDYKFNTEVSIKNGKSLYKTRNAFHLEKKKNEVKLANFTQKAIFSVCNKRNPSISSTDNIQYLPKLKLDFTKNLIDQLEDLDEDIKDAKEDFYFNNLISKKNKKSIFQLSPPRWRDKPANHVPGPAYYDPIPLTIKTKFNKTGSNWI